MQVRNNKLSVLMSLHNATLHAHSVCYRVDGCGKVKIGLVTQLVSRIEVGGWARAV